MKVSDDQISGKDNYRVSKFKAFDTFDLPPVTVELKPESFGKVQPKNKLQQQIIKPVDNMKIEKMKKCKIDLEKTKKQITRANQYGLRAVEKGIHGYEWHAVSGMKDHVEPKKVQISAKTLNVIGSTFRYGNMANNKNGKGLSGSEKSKTLIPGGSKTFTKSTVYDFERVVAAPGLGNGHQYYNRFG